MQMQAVVNPPPYRIIHVGDPGYLTLITAVTALNGDGDDCTLIVKEDVHAVGVNTTVNSNIDLVVPKGADIQIANGVTLTINGPLTAGPYKIFTCTGTGAVAFGTGSVKEVYPEWWAANTTPGTTDMTTAIQAAVTAHPVVRFQSTIYRTTSVVTVGKNRLVGVEPSSYAASVHPSTTTGTWIYLNHTGKGFTIANHGSVVEKLGTYRLQPTPSASYPTAYTPTAHDYDFYSTGYYDITIRNICLLNATKGMYFTGGGGRINISNITGQPLEKGIVFDYCVDTNRIEQVHFWPFWGLSVYGAITTAENKNILDYTMANLDTIQVSRCDGPRITNVFTFCAKSGIRFSENANGISTLGQAFNLYFDSVKYGIWVDDTCTAANSPVWQFFNIVSHGGHPITGTIVGSKGIFAEGKCNFQFTNPYIQYTGLQAIHASVASVVMFINGGLKIYNYDQDATNCTAITMANGSTFTIDGSHVIGSSGGTGGYYDTTGTIYVDEWRAWTPVPSSSGGTVTAFGTCTGRFKIMPKTVNMQVYIPVTTKGTGSGLMTFALPVSTTAVGYWTGSGYNTVTGKQCNCYVSNGSTSYISYYDGTWPIASDGDALYATLQYEIA